MPRVKGIVSKKSPGARDYVSATLIVVLVLLLLGTAIVGECWDQRWIPAYAMIHAPMLLLGWWVGVSRVRVPWKLAGYSLGITFVFILFSRDYVTHLSREVPWNEFDWIIFPSFVANVVEAPIALVFFLAGGRLLRWRQVRLETPFAASSTLDTARVWQYTLKDLLLVTFTLAATLGLLLWTAPYPAWLLALPAMWIGELSGILAGYYGSEALGGVLVTFAVAWVCLGSGRLSRRVAYATLLAFWPPIAATLTVMVAAVSGAPTELEVAASWYGEVQRGYWRILALFAFLLVSFAMVRLAGCRLRCDGRPDEQSERAARVSSD